MTRIERLEGRRRLVLFSFVLVLLITSSVLYNKFKTHSITKTSAVALAQSEPRTAPPAVVTPAPEPTPTPPPEPAPEPAPEPVVEVVEAPVEVAPAPLVSDNEAKAFIYRMESGNNPDRWNSIGCYGLGQDCNGIVYNRCGADYTCQDQYFTEYMLRRYGSWEKAKSFWLARVPINGRDVGNWW